MDSTLSRLPCDGCGLPAAPEHIADRLRRLEWATRFRPVHIGILFVVLGPAIRPEDNFYHPEESNQSIGPLLEALGISASANRTAPESNALAPEAANLLEFQRRGCYLAYLSECPIPPNHERASATIARLGPTLVKRIRFNYKPKLVAPLGEELFPLVDVFRAARIGPLLTLDQALPLPSPGTGDGKWKELFQRAVAAAAPCEYLSPGYDRIPLTATESDLAAGGNS